MVTDACTWHTAWGFDSPQVRFSSRPGALYPFAAVTLPRIPVRLDGIRHGVAVKGCEEPYRLLPQRRLGSCQEASNCQLFDICIEVGCAFLVFSMRLSGFNATMASPTIWRHLTYEQVADVAWLS